MHTVELNTEENLTSYMKSKLDIDLNMKGLEDCPLESVCGLSGQIIVDLAVILLDHCDPHPDVVNPIKQGVLTAIEIIIFG